MRRIPTPAQVDIKQAEEWRPAPLARPSSMGVELRELGRVITGGLSNLNRQGQAVLGHQESQGLRGIDQTALWTLRGPGHGVLGGGAERDRPAVRFHSGRTGRGYQNSRENECEEEIHGPPCQKLQ